MIFHGHHFPYKLNHDDTHSIDTLSSPNPANYDTNCDVLFDYDYQSPENETTIIQNEDNIIKPRCFSRQRRIPAYLEDFQTSLPSTTTISIQYPIHKFISYHALSPSFKNTISLYLLIMSLVPILRLLSISAGNKQCNKSSMLLMLTIHDRSPLFLQEENHLQKMGFSSETQI